MKQRMSAERWAQVDRLLDRILALPPEERASFVDKATQDDAELRAEVTALLRQFDTRDDVLDRSALAVFGRPW